MSELPHPIVVKAAECIGNDEDEDSSQGLIKSSGVVPLFEIKIQQWRGTVWKEGIDPVEPGTFWCGGGRVELKPVSLVATSEQFPWPPVGNSYWPLTNVRTAGAGLRRSAASGQFLLAVDKCQDRWGRLAEVE